MRELNGGLEDYLRELRGGLPARPLRPQGRARLRQRRHLPRRAGDLRAPRRRGRGDRGRARRPQHQRRLRLDPPRAPRRARRRLRGRDRLRLRRRRRPGARGRRQRPGPRRRRADRAGGARDGRARASSDGGVAVTVMSNFGFHRAMEEAGIEVARDQGRRPLRARRAARAAAGRSAASSPATSSTSDFVATGDGIAAALLTMRELGERAGSRTRCRWRSCRRCSSTSRSPTARRSTAPTAVWEAVEREEREPRGPRPRPPAPLRHRAAGPGDGRGAERRGGRGGLRAAGRPRPPRARLSGPTAAAVYPYSPSMCGIVGYVGGRPCRDLLVAGLEKLEYRGYDSAGRLGDRGRRGRQRARGRQPRQPAGRGRGARRNGGGRRRRRPPATTGVAHTRWATHGRVTEENAHPHSDCSDRVHIVLNGIVENHAELRARLEAEGQDFTSETDAEVVAHLIERHYDGDLAAAVRAAFAELRGHYAFVAMHADEPRHAGRRPQGVPAGRRRRRGRDLPRLGDPRLPRRDPHARCRSRTARSSTIDAGGGDDHRRRGQPGRARGRRGHLGRGRRREGRLRDLHAEGDPRTGRRGRRDDRRPAARRRRGRPLRGRARRRLPARRASGS